MTEWVQDALGGGSYLVLTAMLVLENLFPPIPSEIVLPFAGALVSDGGMTFLGAMLAATIGSVTGALIIYGVGRFGGRPLLYRYGRVFRLTEPQLDRADAWFDRYGSWFVFFGRLIPTVRSIVSVPAGASEMPMPRFLILTTAGSALWNAALIGAGWSLGSNWEEAAAVVDRFKLAALAVIALACVAGVVWLLRRRRARTAGAA